MKVLWIPATTNDWSDEDHPAEILGGVRAEGELYRERGESQNSYIDGSPPNQFWLIYNQTKLNTLKLRSIIIHCH